MSLRAKIIAQFEAVAAEQKKKLPPLSDDVVLLDTELDSLCFAVVVARLEDELGIDPFSEDEDAAFPVTLADFFRVYERASNDSKFQLAMDQRARTT